MTSENIELVERRKAGFEEFYESLIPNLVDFVHGFGIEPSYEVLNHAEQYVPYLSRSLENVTIVEEQDRTRLLTGMGYFVGEYFAQKYGGCWYVNDLPNSRHFARYVVGRFARVGNPAPMRATRMGSANKENTHSSRNGQRFASVHRMAARSVDPKQSCFNRAI